MSQAGSLVSARDNGLSKTMLSGSDSDELVIRGSSATIDGDVHTNHTFKHQGGRLTVDGTLSAVNEVDVSLQLVRSIINRIRGNGNNIEDTQENADFVEMPGIVEDIREVAEEVDAEYYENTKRFRGARYSLEDSIIVDGSFRFNVARVTGNV